MVRWVCKGCIHWCYLETKSMRSPECCVRVPMKNDGWRELDINSKNPRGNHESIG